MKIDIIVPTNNILEINSFILSLDKMEKFKKHITLKIIGNGNVYHNYISKLHSVNYDFIRVDNNYKETIVPFAALRSCGMDKSDCDYFLLLDDDHRFNKNSDDFLIRCIKILEETKDCSILCTDKNKNGNTGLKLKIDGFIWTNKGLFLKNIFNQLSFGIHSLLLGAGEDLLFAYMILEKEGLPYTLYGSDITRTEKRYKNGIKVIDNLSYSEKIMKDNIIGYLRNYFNDKEWVHQSNYFVTTFPKDLKQILNKRINSESFSNSSNK